MVELLTMSLGMEGDVVMEVGVLDVHACGGLVEVVGVVAVVQAVLQVVWRWWKQWQQSTAGERGLGHRNYDHT